VEVDEGGEGSADFYEVYVGQEAKYSLTLHPGKAYKFRVRADTPAGVGLRRDLG